MSARPRTEPDREARLMNLTTSDIHRFFNKINIGLPDECWEWTACRGTDPYGNIRYGFFGFRGKNQLAHRIAWVIANGDIPEGMQVLHKCDNPGCCNPAHLFLGTPADNMQDKCNKGRQSHCGTKSPCHGTKSPHAKLTEETIREIRLRYQAGGIRHKDLAAEYGVAKSLIARIIRRESWAWVD